MSHKLLQAWRFRQALTFFSLALVANNSSATSPNFRIVASWDVGHTARIPVAGEVEMIHTSGRSCWYERRILPFPEHLCPNTVIPCVILSGTIACTDHRCVRGRPEPSQVLLHEVCHGFLGQYTVVYVCTPTSRTSPHDPLCHLLTQTITSVCKLQTGYNLTTIVVRLYLIYN